MHERETTPSPLAKLIPEQRPAAAEDERAVRWQRRCRETKLHARENAAPPDRCENVSRTADSRVVARAVPHAPSAFDRELGGEVMANRESFAAPAQSQHGGRVIAAGHGGIGPVAARRGSRVHGFGREALARRHESQLASPAEALPHDELRSGGAVVVTVVITQFLGGERIEQRSDHGSVRDVADLSECGQLDAILRPHGDHSLSVVVRETVAAESAHFDAIARRSPDVSCPQRQSFYAIHMDQLAQRTRAEALAFETREGPASGDLADLGAHTLEIVLADRLGDILDSGGQRSGPRK